jgi:hypothetical protein
MKRRSLLRVLAVTAAGTAMRPLAAAGALPLAIPNSVMSRADEVIR